MHGSPAVRLLRLGAQNLAPFAPRHLRLDVAALLHRCARLAEEIIAADYARNPWQPEHAPRVELSVED